MLCSPCPWIRWTWSSFLENLTTRSHGWNQTLIELLSSECTYLKFKSESEARANFKCAECNLLFSFLFSHCASFSNYLEFVKVFSWAKSEMKSWIHCCIFKNRYQYVAGESSVPRSMAGESNMVQGWVLWSLKYSLKCTYDFIYMVVLMVSTCVTILKNGLRFSFLECFPTYAWGEIYVLS